MCYTFDDDRMDREIRKQRKLEESTTVITTVAGWRTCGGEAIITTATTTSIYESIKYTVGVEAAESFLRNF